jgi:hypothetical protein
MIRSVWVPPSPYLDRQRHSTVDADASVSRDMTGQHAELIPSAPFVLGNSW